MNCKENFQFIDMNDSASLSIHNGTEITGERGVPLEFFEQLEGFVNSPTNSPDNWPRRGQYTAPPKERRIRRSPSPKRKAVAVSVPGRRGLKSRTYKAT